MNADAPVNPREAPALVARPGQFLTFMLATEEYGVDILGVQEIKGWSQVTPLPNAPPYVKGVINLRGTIVPIVDLRQRFALPHADHGPTTVMIVLKVPGTASARTIGIVVDAVSDVCTVDEAVLKPAPDLGSVIRTDFITGLVTLDERMVILLDIGRLVNADLIPETGTVAASLPGHAEEVGASRATHGPTAAAIA